MFVHQKFGGKAVRIITPRWGSCDFQKTEDCIFRVSFLSENRLVCSCILLTIPTTVDKYISKIHILRLLFTFLWSGSRDDGRLRLDREPRTSNPLSPSYFLPRLDLMYRKLGEAEREATLSATEADSPKEPTTTTSYVMKDETEPQKTP